MDRQEQRIKKEYLTSFIVAYVIAVKGMNQLIGAILGRTDGIMMISLIFISGLLVLHFFISDKNENLNLNKKSLLFVYYIVSIIAVYKYAYQYGSVSYEELFVFVLIPIYISFYKIDVKQVLKYLTFLSVLILPFSGTFFKSNATIGFETIGMTASYNTLVFVVAAALHFLFYKKNAGILMWLGYAINIYYLVKILTLGNRGVFISIVVFFVLLLLHEFDENGKIKKNKAKTIFIVTVVGCLVIYVVNDFENILRTIDIWLKSMSIEISAISKNVQKLAQGDITNGRQMITIFTKEGIKNKPFFGNGISTMLRNSGYTIAYPHNVFLQLWYDLGIFVSIPLFYMIVKATIKTFFDSSISKDYSILLIFLYTLSIPRLCVSSQLWVDIPFWFLMMYTITPNIYENSESSDLEEFTQKEFLNDERI